MAPVIKTDARSNVIGALWMVAAMIGFAVEDMFLKVASATVPIGQVLVIFGAGAHCCLPSPHGSVARPCATRKSCRAR